MFFTLFGYWVGGGGDWYTTCFMQFFTLGSSKIEVVETCFFDIVITQNDHSSNVKHVLGRIYVFVNLFGYRGGGGFS